MSIPTKISIITACFNAEKFILDTYSCIRSQVYTNWEWLVTDDCSTDSTFQILNDIAARDCRVKVFRNEVNSGAAVSRNNSLSHVSGDLIAFIDSDDLWKHDKLEKQVKFMAKDIDFSFTAYELVNEDGKPLNKSVDSKQRGSFSYRDMLQKKATLGCSTVIIRRSAFPDLTMPLIRAGQDYAFWLKLLKTGKEAYCFPEILTQYRIRPGSVSRNKVRKAKMQWKIYRDIEKLPLIFSMVNFSYYAWRAVFRA